MTTCALAAALATAILGLLALATGWPSGLRWTFEPTATFTMYALAAVTPVLLVMLLTRVGRPR